MRRLALVLTLAGVATWIAGVVAWMLGVWVTLPPAAVRVLALGLVALTGGDLLVCGAVLGRMGRQSVGGRPTGGEQLMSGVGQSSIDASHSDRPSRLPERSFVDRTT